MVEREREYFEKVVQPPRRSRKRVKRVRAPEPPRRPRGRFLNVLLVVGILGAFGLFFWAEYQRRSVINQLEQTENELKENQDATQRSASEVAQEVLTKLRAHIDIPDQPEPTVATIVDVERLRQSDDFYDQAKNGDHLIITTTRAILFDSQRDRIVDVVPVRVDTTPAEEAAPPAAPPADAVINPEADTQVPAPEPAAP